MAYITDKDITIKHDWIVYNKSNLCLNVENYSKIECHLEQNKIVPKIVKSLFTLS